MTITTIQSVFHFSPAKLHRSKATQGPLTGNQIVSAKETSTSDDYGNSASLRDRASGFMDSRSLVSQPAVVGMDRGLDLSGDDGYDSFDDDELDGPLIMFTLPENDESFSDEEEPQVPPGDSAICAEGTLMAKPLSPASTMRTVVKRSPVPVRTAHKTMDLFPGRVAGQPCTTIKEESETDAPYQPQRETGLMQRTNVQTKVNRSQTAFLHGLKYSLTSTDKQRSFTEDNNSQESDDEEDEVAFAIAGNDHVASFSDDSDGEIETIMRQSGEVEESPIDLGTLQLQPSNGHFLTPLDLQLKAQPFLYAWWIVAFISHHTSVRPTHHMSALLRDAEPKDDIKQASWVRDAILGAAQRMDQLVADCHEVPTLVALMFVSAFNEEVNRIRIALVKPELRRRKLSEDWEEEDTFYVQRMRRMRKLKGVGRKS